VLEDQQAQHYLCRCLLPTASSALLVALALRVINGVEQFVIFQQFIHGSHPGFPEFLDFLCEKGLP
jgi:hypothetical protein